MILVDFQRFVFDFLFRSVRGDDIIIDVHEWGNGGEKRKFNFPRKLNE